MRTARTTRSTDYESTDYTETDHASTHNASTHKASTDKANSDKANSDNTSTDYQARPEIRGGSSADVRKLAWPEDVDPSGWGRLATGSESHPGLSRALLPGGTATARLT